MVRLIHRWWRWVTARLKRSWWREVRYCAAADELPDDLAPRILYLVGTLGYEKWAVFACPCGRDHAAWLNLQRSQHPRWRIGGRGLSRGLRPSVWFEGPWDCHFWIWRGRVLWVRDRRATTGRTSARWRETIGPYEDGLGALEEASAADERARAVHRSRNPDGRP